MHRPDPGRSKLHRSLSRRSQMKRLAQIVGVVFLIAGIAGFIPALCPNGLLLGAFAVNGMHNIVHILSGILALAMSFGTEALARTYFRIVGVVYALVTVLGFVAGGGGMLMGIAMNMGDHFLHIPGSAAR